MVGGWRLELRDGISPWLYACGIKVIGGIERRCVVVAIYTQLARICRAIHQDSSWLWSSEDSSERKACHSIAMMLVQD